MNGNEFHELLGELGDNFKPSTLAAIVADLRSTPKPLSASAQYARHVLRQALINNVGDDEADKLIYEASL